MQESAPGARGPWLQLCGAMALSDVGDGCVEGTWGAHFCGFQGSTTGNHHFGVCPCVPLHFGYSPEFWIWKHLKRWRRAAFQILDGWQSGLSRVAGSCGLSVRAWKKEAALLAVVSDRKRPEQALNMGLHAFFGVLMYLMLYVGSRVGAGHQAEGPVQKAWGRAGLSTFRS